MKTKIFILGLICLFYINCAQEFDEVQAEDVIKESFELTEKDSVEILGISIEAKDVAIVEFKINDFQFKSKLERKGKGLYMHDYQNELGESVYKDDIVFNEPSRRKKSMKDIIVISKAIADYFTDNEVLPEQDGNYGKNSSFYKALSPFYVKELPIKDGWGNNYLVYCGKACDEQFGFPGNPDYFLVVSYGRDGKKEDWKFDPGNPEAGLFEAKIEDDFDIDIIMWKGLWIRAPWSAVR